MYEPQTRQKVEQEETTRTRQEVEPDSPAGVTYTRTKESSRLAERLMQNRVRTREAIRVRQEAEQNVKGRLKAFFDTLVNVSTKTLAFGLLGAALAPFFGPAGAIGVSLAAAVIEIQDKLKPLDLGLQDDTVRKLVEPLQGRVFDERELRRVIEEVSSQDRAANKDLAKALYKLQPIIQEVARSTKVPRSTNINISGPVQGLIVGNENTITQTFSGFLPKDTW